VCQREGKTGVSLGKILGVFEGGDNRVEGGGDIGCFRGSGEKW